MKSGIYEIYNKTNGKRYIGSTIKFDKRFREHRNDLNNNQHHSIKLQRAWNKYGPDVFDFKIIELVEPNLLISVEQFYIDSYDFREDLYNTCPIAGSTLGYKASEKTKQKLKLSNARTLSLRVAKLRKFTDAHVSEMKRMRDNGMSLNEIGEVFKCNHQTILNNINKYSSVTEKEKEGYINTSKTRVANKCRKFTSEQVEEMKQLRNSGMTWKFIAHRFNAPHSSIQNNVLKY